jgi:hypothetical protein
MTRKLGVAELAKTLVHNHYHGVLSTVATDGGYPYGSVIDYLALSGGDVLVLLDEQAEHFRYLNSNPKASLLINAHLAEHEALHIPRVTLLGDGRSVERPEELISQYLLRHPDSAPYITKDSLHFFQLDVTGVRYIPGTGRAIWLEAVDYRAADADPLGEEAPWAMHELNDRQHQSLVWIARNLLDQKWASTCRVVNLDRFGFDMVCYSRDRHHAVRVALGEEAPSIEAFHQQFRKLAARARLLDEGTAADS